MPDLFLPLVHFFNALGFHSLIEFFARLQILFLIVSAGLFAFLVFLLIKTSYIKYVLMLDVVEFFTSKPYVAGKVAKEWKNIQKRLETGRESEYKLAIIEADSLLHMVLEKIGYAGKTFEEQTANITTEVIADIEEIREAHRIRNNIAYDPSYVIDFDETKRVLQMYERALFEIGAL